MKKNNLEKWGNLLSELDLSLEAFGVFLQYPERLSSFNEELFTDFASQEGFDFPQGCLSTLSEEELDLFESKTGLVLPQEYREYCQVFGSGGFGLNEFAIDCPSIQYLEETLDSHKGILEAHVPRIFKEGHFIVEPCEATELLQNAYLIGFGVEDQLFVFDLRTYSEQDRSYDIYATLSNTSEGAEIHYLGRSFYSFIRDVCLGTATNKNFTDWLGFIPQRVSESCPESSDDKSNTFFPFPIAENLPQ
ncbi:SMI1/KNR4 family protein [Lusitaniella coriacea LEGE 07157]|uniref:SMI1/KNR4 family protein n=1 Tax=Lusitaniella coriacea LEGE 07157 TaxID=945747 RepID=A0A8J7DVQ8_9CYAN|nr:SMI1/KNR4 family protein [Lusitaniella coriacea]MBE9115902.1 SMI1/KNR4 family protein [Lusitaniella coriacea LEGE 07157]